MVGAGNRFEGRAALVTGGGSGIGRAVAERVHAEGGAVLVVDVAPDRVAATVEQLGDRASGYVVDLGDRAAVAGLGEDVLREHGAPDALFLNAGISDRFTAAIETTDELWDRVLGVNLSAAFFVARALLPAMIERGSGAVVITGSVASVVGGGGGVAYTVSKHGLLGLTRSLAASYGQAGIRVNCILPGAISTAMTVSEAAQVDDADGAVAATPAGRWARPGEVAAVAAFLASDEAGFVHGSAYPVDGGWTLT